MPAYHASVSRDGESFRATVIVHNGSLADAKRYAESVWWDADSIAFDEESNPAIRLAETLESTGLGDSLDRKKTGAAADYCGSDAPPRAKACPKNKWK